MKKELRKFREFLRKILICSYMRKRLTNHNFTIFASDCTGGVLYHEFGERFSSPLINMYMDATDYLNFIYNPHKYLNEKMVEIPEDTKKYGYPVVSLSDIRIHLVHYNNVHEAQIKWDERKKRINWDNCFYIMNDRNSCKAEHIQRFENFPASNKVLFVHKEVQNKNSVQFYIRGSEQKDYVDTMTAYTSCIHRRFDQFDFVSWFNGGIL